MVKVELRSRDNPDFSEILEMPPSTDLESVRLFIIKSYPYLSPKFCFEDSDGSILDFSMERSTLVSDLGSEIYLRKKYAIKSAPKTHRKSNKGTSLSAPRIVKDNNSPSTAPASSRVRRRILDAWVADSTNNQIPISARSKNKVPHHLLPVFNVAGIDPNEVDLSKFREYKGKSSVSVSFDDSTELRRHLLKIIVLKAAMKNALIIQCAARCMIARISLRKKIFERNSIITAKLLADQKAKDRIERREKIRQNAATKIQSIIRGFLAYRFVCRKLELTMTAYILDEKNADEKKTHAATKIQCAQRIRSAKVVVKQKRKRQKASTTIQSKFRQFRAKKSVKVAKVRKDALKTIQRFLRRTFSRNIFTYKWEELRLQNPERLLILKISKYSPRVTDENTEVKQNIIFTGEETLRLLQDDVVVATSSFGVETGAEFSLSIAAGTPLAWHTFTLQCILNRTLIGIACFNGDQFARYLEQASSTHHSFTLMTTRFNGIPTCQLTLQLSTNLEIWQADDDNNTFPPSLVEGNENEEKEATDHPDDDSEDCIHTIPHSTYDVSFTIGKSYTKYKKFGDDSQIWCRGELAKILGIDLEDIEFVNKIGNILIMFKVTNIANRATAIHISQQLLHGSALATISERFGPVYITAIPVILEILPRDI